MTKSFETVMAIVMAAGYGVAMVAAVAINGLAAVVVASLTLLAFLTAYGFRFYLLTRGR